MAESQAFGALDERLFDDPSQLSQLLRQRAGSNRVVHFTTSTESNQTGFAASASTFAIPPQLERVVAGQQLPVVPALPTHAPSSRRVATARDVNPALLTHHSAPTSTGFMTEVDGAPRMHHTFAAMDTPGDTQPDSQIYRDWTSGIHRAGETFILNKLNTPKSLFTEHVDDDDEGDSPTDGVELVESSQEQQSPTVTSPTVIHDGDVLGELPQGLYAPTSPLKFETPGMAGRKRDSSGQMLSSAVRTNTTPGTVVSASAFPGFTTGGIAPMSLTQAWQNTQAPTSPAPAEPIEDVAFTRPSPNFSHVRHSSPIPAFSSPIKALQNETPRTDPIIRSSSEPRTDYVSMKESQERRKRTTREQPLQLPDEDSWEQPTAAQWRTQKKKHKEHLERKAAMAFAHISAPVPVSPRRAARKAKVSSPIKLRPSRPSPRREDSKDGEDSADELALNKHNDDLSPDELSQDVPFTARTQLRHKSTINSVQVPKTSSHPIRTHSGQSPNHSSQNATASSQLQRESQLQASASQPLLKDPLRPQSSRDTFAIMDSQPDTTAYDESVPRPKSLRFPSSPSMNQYSINQTTMGAKTGYTSQVVSSSMPPMPPSSSPAAVEPVLDEEITPEGEKRFPSSPPIGGSDDELMYDEHENAYNEYDEEVGVRDSAEPEAANEDVVMAEDDDLPLTKPEPDEDETAKVEDEMDELDLIRPQKVDPGTDQEVPENLEHEDVQEPLLGDDDPPHSSEVVEAGRDESMAAPEPPRTQRQDTVPETDALEETQPSFFPTNDCILSNDEIQAHHSEASGTHDQTNSTEPFHTAREQTSESQGDRQPPASSKEGGSDTIQAGDRLRSVQDIYNLPETQQSAIEEEIEMPRLSGLDEHDEDNFMAPSSPALPSAKRRKVTYTAKRNIFRSPHKSTGTADVEPDQPPSSPDNSVRTPQDPDVPTASAQEREQQGALAALHARGKAQAPYTRQATLKSKPAPRPTRAQTQKKGALKSVSKELLDLMSSPPNSPNAAAGSHRETPITPTKRGTRGRVVDADVDMLDVNQERDELADTTPKPANDETSIRPASDRGETSTGEVLMPHRVFASWPGSHFYPATCLGRVVSRQLQIRFDDGNTTSLEATQVRALDLRLGDHVKVDEPGMKKHTYIVVGFKDKVDDLAGEEFPITDRSGYATVVLEEKARDSLPKAKAIVQPISVPIAKIYLTTQLWTRLRDRSFSFSPAATPSKSRSRMGTPVTAIDPAVTPSFSRRGTTVPSLLKDATNRAGSVASSSTRSTTGVFSNMAFVLTSTAADVDKEAIARVIKANGGQVLEQGFHELFNYESAGTPSSSQSLRRSASVGDTGLSLKPAYQDLGFVALISDSFSRSTKYIQALALNVPCLHLRWVQDSLSASRAAPFGRYLLPAGVSKFLDPNGVVRSRTMTVYDPSADDMSYAQIVGDRDLLLHDQTVLLVTGKSKKEIEKRQPFVFLSHALGSANVGRCADLTAAADMLVDGQWDWIYVDNGEAGVADAAAELFGTGKPAASSKAKKGKRRRRDDTEEKEELVARGEVSGQKVKITCSEFVIQSLILGALVEE
ncbi:hypothetical protein CC86DRAFT_370043 [Ophiobolus disseminans]|uniref:BRCT domain-containing protein n=1 Tax=Ophiobolus disseminans TaxID=1469910 RepID=A0A6A7A2Z5_9PLEO|nr:hypothetical protein CC86DRAFT_370043 [Ophiobolus disseminans]